MTDTTPSQDFATEKLDSFKNRMHITTTDDGEMTRLAEMLESSYVAVIRLIGSPDASDPEVKDLIFERARYIYNDALDEFLTNYELDIRNLHNFYCKDGFDGDYDSEAPETEVQA